MEFPARAKEKYKTDGATGLARAAAGYAFRRFAKPVIPYSVRNPRVIRNRVRHAVLGETVFENKGVLMDIDTPRLTQQARQEIIEDRFGPGLSSSKVFEEIVAKTDANLVELGAGTGWMSARINRGVGESHKHIAVEANPSILPVLKRTRELNACDFIIENSAYSPGEEEVEFKIYEDYNDGTLFDGRGGPTQKDVVPATTIASLQEKHDMSRFILYSNMEGGEFQLLKEELDVVKASCPWIKISFHGFTDHDPDRYLSTMEEHFDRVWSNEPRYPGTHVYKNPHL